MKSRSPEWIALLIVILLPALLAPAGDGSGTERTLPEWVTLLSAADPAIRQDACLALANMRDGAAAAVPALANALTDPDRGVRNAAAFALFFVGEAAKGALPELERALKDEDPAVRSMAAMTLGELAAWAGRSTPALEDAMRDEDPSVRLYAQSALEAIQAAAPAVVAGGRHPDEKAIDEHATGPLDTVSAEHPDQAQEIARERRRGPAAEALPALEPEPAHEGRPLTEWIARLDKPDAGERRLAAAAIGEIGPAARGALGPLNRLRLHDEHDMVRHQAALAIARILRLSLGDLLPKPPASHAQPEAPPPEGLVFYIKNLHDVSEEGLELLPSMELVGGFRHSLSRFVYHLRFLDLKEAAIYRKDAKARGLDASKRLGALLDSDSEKGGGHILFAPDPTVEVRGRIFRPYTRDYVVRITCNGQTSYQYFRWIEGETTSWSPGEQIWGRGECLALGPGTHNLGLTIWTQDGFRLDFTAPVVVKHQFDDRSPRAPRSPADVAIDLRRELAALDPEDIYFRLAQARLMKEIAGRISREFLWLGKNDPLRPEDVLEFAREEFRLRRAAAELSPAYPENLGRDLASLLDVIERIPTTGSLELGCEIVQFLERFLANPEIEPSSAAYSREGLADCYGSLGQLAIAATMDIEACRAFFQLAASHSASTQLLRPMMGRIDVATLLHTAPQPGWWRAPDDEHRPPSVATILENLGVGGDAKAEREKAPPDERLLDAGVSRAIAEVDERRAAEVSWLIGREEQFAATLAGMRETFAKLRVLCSGIAAIERKRASLEILLRHEAVDTGDEDWSTTEWTRLLQPTSEMREELAGSARGGIAAMRAVVEQRIDALIERRTLLENERDRIIADSMLEFESIIRSLEAREPGSLEPAVAKHAEELVRAARSEMKFARARLCAAAGMESEFREAAREGMDAGPEAGYQLRLLESLLMQGKGDVSVALRAARLALEAKGEDESGAPVTQRDGTTVRVHTPASRVVKELELRQLFLIHRKTSAEAETIRELGYRALSGHGQPGLSGELWDFFMAPVWSAAGEDSLLVPVYEAGRGAMDTVARQAEFLVRAGRTVVSGDDPIRLAEEYVDWLHEQAEQRRAAMPRNPVAGPSIDEEDTRGGKMISQVREMGTVLDDASQTCVGIMLIAQLREADVPFATIRSMTRERYKAIVAERFRGHQLSDARAARMWQAIHYALRQEDVARVMEGRSQVLDAEAGRGYYTDAVESLQPGWRDLGESQFTMFNILMTTLPNARVSGEGLKSAVAGKGWANGFLNWANPTGEAARASIALKQAAAEAAGLSKLFDWMGNHETGRKLLADFVQVTDGMSCVGRAGLDFLIQQNASMWTRHAVSYAVEVAGGSEESQIAAADAAERLVQVATAFGLGDVDVSREFAGRALSNQQQMSALLRVLTVAESETSEMSRLADPHRRALRDAVRGLQESGRLEPGAQIAARRSVRELQGEIESLQKLLPSPRHAHPVINRHYEELLALYEGLTAATEGMPAQARTFAEVADGIAGKIESGRKSLLEQVQKVQRKSVVGGGTLKQIEPKTPWNDPILDFRGERSVLPVADRMVLDPAGRAREAQRLYAAGFHLYEELGMLSDPKARVLAWRWKVAGEVADAQELIARQKAASGPLARSSRPISAAEVREMLNSPGVRFERSGKGITNPWVILVDDRPVFIAKPPGARMPLHGTQAEIVGPRIAAALDCDSPASLRTSLPIESRINGRFALFYEAGEAVPPGQSTLREMIDLERATDITLTPVGPGAPDVNWAVRNGKRIGIFAPHQAAAFVSGNADEVLHAVAQRTGGRALDVVPLDMQVRETPCILVRYVQGTDLEGVSDGMRIAQRQPIARGMLARMIMGDHDGHAGNLRLAPDGHLESIDWNLANMLETEIGLPIDSAEFRAALKFEMKRRLLILRGFAPDPIYEAMRPAAIQLEWDDFAEGIGEARGWSINRIRELLGEEFGPQTERAVRVMRMRIELLEEVIDEAYPRPRVRPGLARHPWSPSFHQRAPASISRWPVLAA